MATFTDSPVDAELVLSLYRRMLELRQFELKVQELYRQAQLPGFVHLYIGEEAVATGVCAHLRREDKVYSTHRGHGHAIAKGVPAQDVMAELYGKAAGCSGGRGGSMHIYASEYGLMGTNGIVASGPPLATGAALSAQLRRSGEVVVCFFGDGASNAGPLHEALNFAALWNLPVVFVCENNLYATEMALHRAARNTEIASRAAAYLMSGVAVDGNDVLEVYRVAGEAVKRARSEGGPTLIECKTYRQVGHHEGDPGTEYRTKEEVEGWKNRCPIQLLRERILAGSLATLADLEAIESAVATWIKDAVAYALQCADPPASTVLDHVHC